MQTNHTSEKGITLIALLIMIIILIILTAVVLGTITGDEPLIGTATDTAQDYKIESYREEISHTVHSEIIAKSAIGETATTGDIADALNKQDWIKTAYVNADATLEVGNITAQVNEGYIYQIYYNSIYGKIEIDYIGKDKDPDDLNSLTLTARYEKSVTSIFATAEDKKNGVAKLELFYKDKVIGIIEEPKEEVSWNIGGIGTGWYKVKATSTKGTQKIMMIEVINNESTTTNNPPVLVASYYDKGIDYIKINVKGVDLDEDQLIYKLYVSTDGKNWGEPKQITEKTSQDTQVILTASDLSEYTIYYWKVEVTDDKINNPIIVESKNKVRIYCRGRGLHCGNGVSCRYCDNLGVLLKWQELDEEFKITRPYDEVHIYKISFWRFSSELHKTTKCAMCGKETNLANNLSYNIFRRENLNSAGAGYTEVPVCDLCSDFETLRTYFNSRIGKNVRWHREPTMNIMWSGYLEFIPEICKACKGRSYGPCSHGVPHGIFHCEHRKNTTT